jgi:Protein of unknown function (DUF3995)
MDIFSIINAIILSLISALHFFWVFGGKWGADAAIPTNLEGKNMLNPTGKFPSIFATLLVAFGLLFMTFLHLGKVQTILPLPTWIYNYGLKIIATIFMIRAIGDFRYAGFFKKIKGTKFANFDTKYYSPLCLLLGFNAFMTTIF